MNEGFVRGLLILASFFLLVAGTFLFISDNYFDQGKTFEDEKLLEQAKNSYKKAVLYNPINPQYRRHLGIIHFSLGELNEAFIEAKKAVLYAPHDANNRKLLGRLYAKIGKEDLAEEEFAKAVEYDATLSPEMYKDLALLYLSQGRYYDIIELSGNILPKYPSEFFQSRIASVIIAVHGEEIRSDISDLYNILGISYASTGEAKLAKESFEKSLEHGPNNISSQRNLKILEGEN